MTIEELKAEATKNGYMLVKSRIGWCSCWCGRGENRKKCTNYDFMYVSKRGKTWCKKKEAKE